LDILVDEGFIMLDSTMLILEVGRTADAMQFVEKFRYNWVMVVKAQFVTAMPLIEKDCNPIEVVEKEMEGRLIVIYEPEGRVFVDCI
jgi:hypothetical protein